jgi:CheY-like chemotaxis protein
MSGRIVAVAMAKSKRPDVVIMDLMMPRIDGAEATRLICDAVPETKVLILTSYATSADIVRAIDAGAAHQGGLLETWRFQPHRGRRNRPSQASPQDLMNLSNLRLL